MKNITLFGRKISLPCAAVDLGEDYSIDERSECIIFGDVITSGLYYKEEKIGTVNLSDSGGEERIIRLYLGFGLSGEYIRDE